MRRLDPIVAESRPKVKRRLKRRVQKCTDAHLRVRLSAVLPYAEGRGMKGIASTLGCADSTATNGANHSAADAQAALLDRRPGNGESKLDDDTLAAPVELSRRDEHRARR